MKKHTLTRVMALSMAAVMSLSLAACGNGGGSGKEESSGGAENASVPAINEITLGEDYTDLKASIKILTNRTDIADTVYAGYAEDFMKTYPNITVEYEAITDYEESLKLRLPTGDWGDICFIPTSITKSELSDYFISFGDYETLNEIYNFCGEKTYDNTVWGLANGGTASGVVYNKKVFKDAGIETLPKTPDEFLEDLKIIKEKTDAVPLYTNFAAGWPMGAWDAYTTLSATGDPDFKNNMPHMKDPFAKRDDMTGPYAIYYVLYESVKRGLIEEDPASTDWESCKGMINNGEIATMVLGSWAVEQFKKAGDHPDDVGYMPFPVTVNGTQYAGSGGNYAYGINSKATTDNQIASMVYVKWLLEESPIFKDEGSIAALKGKELPSMLADFGDCEIIFDNASPSGEEDLFDNVNNESEVGLNNDDYPDCEILEAALYGTSTLDELMNTWNEKWTSGQEALGVEVNK